MEILLLLALTAASVVDRSFERSGLLLLVVACKCCFTEPNSKDPYDQYRREHSIVVSGKIREKVQRQVITRKFSI